MLLTRRLLVNAGKYRKLTINSDSNELIIEPYDGEQFSIYDNEETTPVRSPSPATITTTPLRSITTTPPRSTTPARSTHTTTTTPPHSTTPIRPATPATTTSTQELRGKKRKMRRITEKGNIRVLLPVHQSDAPISSEEEEESDDDDDPEEGEEGDGNRSEEEEKGTISESAIDMGNDLHIILQNIHKIPSPLPTNNPQHTPKKYRKMLIHHISTHDEFGSVEDLPDLFMSVNFNDNNNNNNNNDDSSIQKFSLNFLLNDQLPPTTSMAISPSQSMVISPSSSQSMAINFNSMDITGQDVVDSDLMSLLNDPAYNEPTLLLDLTDEAFDQRKTQICATLTETIMNLYDSSLKEKITSEIMRRRQFHYLISILTYFEKLEIFCNIYKNRRKGVTIKSQAFEIIVKHSELPDNGLPRVQNQEISKLVGQATRVRRLLELASNNYNILYAFPNLKPQFFSRSKMSVVAFERWLLLVETGKLCSPEEGQKSFDKFKDNYKNSRIEFFKKK